MIKRIRIQALKSIQKLDVECSRLNLIVGTNSSGKSTFLQSLLLDAQNGSEKFGLNGPVISLGEFREVRNFHMPNDNIKIELHDECEKPAYIIFEENSSIHVSGYDEIRDSLVADIYSLGDFDDSSSTMHLDYQLGFHYLSCHRLGVQDIYKKNLNSEDEFGIEGEYTLAYLLKHGPEEIDENLVYDKSTYTGTLLDQVNYWLEKIVGTTVLLNELKKTNYFQVLYNNNPAIKNSENLYCRPINVGSGISYLISILIMCLGSNYDDVLVIENPEIHLHPKAQSNLCEFFYFISSNNRQVFIETHSDHIFNGIRAGIATKQMEADRIAVNFFSLNENFCTQCNPIQFGEMGKILGKNPDMDLNDLFDQFEIDLDRMLGLD